MKLRSWFQRNRRLALALSAAFIIFEVSRATAIWQFLLPGWGDDLNAELAAMGNHPPHITAMIALLAVAFFVVPMAALIYAGLKIRRRLSHYWAAFNRRG